VGNFHVWRREIREEGRTNRGLLILAAAICLALRLRRHDKNRKSATKAECCLVSLGQQPAIVAQRGTEGSCCCVSQHRSGTYTTTAVALGNIVTRAGQAAAA
ncbi:unnamed protein product, partial [Ectocarpus fasciculatus]